MLFQTILRHSSAIFDDVEGRLTSERSTRFGIGTMIFALFLIWTDDRLRQFFPHAENDPRELD